MLQGEARKVKIAALAILPHISSNTLLARPWVLSRYVDPEGFLKADRPDRARCSAPPLRFSSKRAQPLRHDGISVPCSGIIL
jgi:hypothetical protein